MTMISESEIDMREPLLDLGPEAYDALSELAMEWGVDMAEAYRRMLWIAQDPEATQRALTSGRVPIGSTLVALN